MMPTFKTEPHIKETIDIHTRYDFEVYESDPYYHVIVTKNGKHFADHLLGNDETEFIELIDKYKKQIYPRQSP
jgi:hypothetical protein